VTAYTHRQKKTVVIIIFWLAAAALLGFNFANWLDFEFGIVTSQRIVGVLMIVIAVMGMKNKLNI